MIYGCCKNNAPQRGDTVLFRQLSRKVRTDKKAVITCCFARHLAGDFKPVTLFLKSHFRRPGARIEFFLIDNEIVVDKHRANLFYRRVNFIINK